MERLVESKQFIEAIAQPWSRHFGRQAGESARQAGILSETGDFAGSESALQLAGKANEKGRGVLRFWDRVLGMMTEEGYTEIPNEVVESLVDTFRERRIAPSPAELPPVESPTFHQPITEPLTDEPADWPEALPVVEPPAEGVFVGPGFIARKYTPEEIEAVRKKEAEMKKEQLSRKGLAPLQQKIAYAIFALNREEGKYQNPSSSDIAAATYEIDKISDPQERAKRQINGAIYVSTSRKKILDILTNNIPLLETDPDAISANTREFLDWLLEQEEYAAIPKDILPATLAEVAARRINYQQLLERGVRAVEQEPVQAEVVPAKEALELPTSERPKQEYPIFDNTDVSLLIEVLRETPASRLKSWNINLTAEDLKELNSITGGNRSAEFASEAEKTERTRLLKEKLVQFFHDQEGVYLANADSASVQRLLDHFQDLDSEEVIEELFAKTQEAPTYNPRFSRLSQEEIQSLRIK